MNMAMDRWALALLAPLICWVLLNGIDDLIIAVASLFLPRSKPPDLSPRPERRMAIFVPLWKEHEVIEKMVAQNAGSLRYGNYDIFIGVYPNDAPTLAAVAEAQKRYPNVHRADVPHNGPTSKADCLNAIYQRMLRFEEEKAARFEMILTHDAEDVVHPDSLSCINCYADKYDMVQIPVLALPTPWKQMTHGVYCDEFAQIELLEMPVRQMLGGFIPSNGVGTAFSRRIMDRIVSHYGGPPFDPDCQTEDYESGFRVARLGGKQIFVRVHRNGTGFLATREFFPTLFWRAVRQRTRWTIGIGLQSWGKHGLRETVNHGYWFWRDRKTLISNLASPLANVLTVYGLVRGLPFHVLIRAVLALQIAQAAIRMTCSAKIYGWKFASTAPVRIVWGNFITALATVMAIWKYCSSKFTGKPLQWLKTEHAFPEGRSLTDHRRLEEILVGSGFLTADALAIAVASRPEDETLSRHLLKSGAIPEQVLYQAISVEQNLPFGKPDDVAETVTRSFPVSVARKWSVLPFKLVAGHLHVAGSEPPSDEMQKELRKFSSMTIRFQLVTPTEFEELAELYLPSDKNSSSRPLRDEVSA